MEVGAPDDHPTGIFETLDAHPGPGGDLGVEEGSTRRDPTFVVDQVLQGDGHAGERPDFVASGQSGIDVGCPLQSAFIVE
jgi:hypothetical protein